MIGSGVARNRTSRREGEVLEILVQRRRDKRAAVKLMRKLLRKQGFAPQKVTTDNCAPTARPSGILGFPVTMSRAYGKTIGPRIRIK